MTHYHYDLGSKPGQAAFLLNFSNFFCSNLMEKKKIISISNKVKPSMELTPEEFFDNESAPLRVEEMQCYFGGK